LEYSIIAQGLSKRFKRGKGKGYINALKEVSFKVKQGEILGVMGPNGAGKTTLLKILACVLRPDSGDAWINGYHIIKDRNMAKASSNLIIGGSWLGLHYSYTVRENLYFFGKLFGVPKRVLEERIEEAIDILEMRNILDKSAVFLSTGEVHKTILAKILLIRTPVLLLDEPTRSLDPVLANKVRALLANVISKKYKMSILMTSHQAIEVETIADRVILLNKGKVIACDDPRNLVRRLGKEEKITIILNTSISSSLLQKLKRIGVRDILTGEFKIKIICRDVETVMEKVIQILKSEGIKIRTLTVEKISLEDVFRALTKGET